MEAMAALSRTVIDEVLSHTQEDILIGHDEHHARRIVRELQTRWESKISAAYAQLLSDREKLAKSMPGQIHPSYQLHSAASTGRLSSTPAAKFESSAPEKPMSAAAKRKAASSSPKKKSKKAKVDYSSGESSLGTDDESENEEVDPVTKNLVLCQFSKIQNHKGRWKCQFSGGIMSLKGRDYVFRDATGDFRFDSAA